MNLELSAFIITNTITSVIFFKYISDYITTKIDQKYNDKINFILKKINCIKFEVAELHENIDVLEDYLNKKHFDIRVSQEQLTDKIDCFIVSNYDITD